MTPGMTGEPSVTQRHLRRGYGDSLKCWRIPPPVEKAVQIYTSEWQI